MAMNQDDQNPESGFADSDDVKRAGTKEDIRGAGTTKSGTESDSDDVKRAGTKEDIRGAGTTKSESESDSKDTLRNATKN